jgi:heat shock protein HslJ
MKASAGFAFFLLFLAGFALVNLKNFGEEAESSIPTVEYLSATAWRPSHIGEMTLADDVELYVQFETDGELAGFAGCNRFFGSYALSDSTLEIGPLGSTRMACPPDVTAFEYSFLEALQSAATVARAETRIAIRNDQELTTIRFDAIDRKNSE